MIASLLPGLRHVRSPLTAGVLWLLVAYLAAGHAVVPSKEGNRLEQRLVQAVEFVGPALTVTALSFVALLVGGLIPEPRYLQARLTQVVAILRRTRRQPHPRQFVVLEKYVSDVALSVADRVTWADVIGNPQAPSFLLRRASEIWEHQFPSPPPETPVDYSMLNRLIQDSILEELPALTLQLQIERESLYNEIDRERAEAELRLRIFLPLVALIGVSAWLAGSAWVLPLVLIPVALLYQSVLAENNALARQFTALAYGVMKSPTVEYLSQFRERARLTRQVEQVEEAED